MCSKSWLSNIASPPQETSFHAMLDHRLVIPLYILQLLVSAWGGLSFHLYWRNPVLPPRYHHYHHSNYSTLSIMPLSQSPSLFCSITCVFLSEQWPFIPCSKTFTLPYFPRWNLFGCSEHAPGNVSRLLSPRQHVFSVFHRKVIKCFMLWATSEPLPAVFCIVLILYN